MRSCANCNNNIKVRSKDDTCDENICCVDGSPVEDADPTACEFWNLFYDDELVL